MVPIYPPSSYFEGLRPLVSLNISVPDEGQWNIVMCVIFSGLFRVFVKGVVWLFFAGNDVDLGRKQMRVEMVYS